MRQHTYCCVCEGPCSYEEAVREVDGCYLRICYDCLQLPDCPDCGGRGEDGETRDCCDRCGGTGKG